MSTPLAVSEVLKASDNLRLSWFDPHKSIIVVEIFGPWTWENAFEFVPLMNHIVERQPNNVYTVYYYQTRSTTLLPKGSGLTNLHRLVEINPPNEKLVFFVRQDSLTRQFMSMVGKVYGMADMLRKYRFVATWQEAMQIIEMDKAQAL